MLQCSYEKRLPRLPASPTRTKPEGESSSPRDIGTSKFLRGYGEAMTEQEWLDTRQSWKLLGYLIDEPRVCYSQRKLRLFTCALCRRLGHLLTDPRSLAAVDVAERCVEGSVTEQELNTAHRAA